MQIRTVRFRSRIVRRYTVHSTAPAITTCGRVSVSSVAVTDTSWPTPTPSLSSDVPGSPRGLWKDSGPSAPVGVQFYLLTSIFLPPSQKKSGGSPENLTLARETSSCATDVHSMFTGLRQHCWSARHCIGQYSGLCLFSCYSLGGDTARPGRLRAKLCKYTTYF